MSSTQVHPDQWSLAEGRIRRQRHVIIVLVFAAIMLNYIDRQVIALLKPMLQTQFGWSNQDYSHMAAAYQFAAAIAFLSTGWFIDRVGLRRGFAWGVGVWSLAGMWHGLVYSVSGFVGARLVLGAAEAVGTPAKVKTAALYFPVEERSMMIGVGNMASNCGAILAPLAILPLAAWLGWRAAFLVSGGLGLVWVVLWTVVKHPPALALSGAAVHGTSVPWAKMLRDRRQWAIIAGKCFSDEVWWFLLFFIPDLFHRRFGLEQSALGGPVALAYTLAALGSLSGGWLPSVLLRRGWPLNRARKMSLLIPALLILPTPLVLKAGNAWVAALILGVALFAHQAYSTNVFGMSADLFAPRIVGTAVGIGAFAGNLSGMAMLETAGWSLDHGHGYAPLLWVCAISYLVATALIQVFVPVISVNTETSNP
ncbi:MAG TPA: MFS transporter [Acidobacteriaceae bacterium]|jgi:ACS family hexuronate transporter-like MFS transporter